MNLISSVF